MAITSEIVPYGGWQRNLRLANDHVELITTLDVGPRILSYRTTDGKNILKNFHEEHGQSGEDTFMLRGGHRLWTSPEDELITYHQDNHPVEHCASYDGSVVILSHQQAPIQIEKRLKLHLDEETSKVALLHTIANNGEVPLTLATWALTILETGGMEIIPQPKFKPHGPGDFLPNRNIALWSYTDLSDSRYHIGKDFLMLRQVEGEPPTKIGLSHREKWVAYVWENSLFLKTIEFLPHATYPDFGSNFETFTRSDMIEIESLGPFVTLQPGETTSHTEDWHLFDITEPLEITSEENLQEWIHPFLVQAGLTD